MGSGRPGDAPELRIELLGRFRVALRTHAIPDDHWRRRSAELVKLLALSHGHALHREQVLDLLWPNLEPAAATNNLHRTLHAARRSLEPGLAASQTSAYLRLRHDQVTLEAPGGVDVDLEAFERACALARQRREPTAYQAALDLYAGDLLPGDRYADWAAGPRDEARELYIRTLIELARLHLDGREGAAAELVLERLVAVEPAHEPAQVLLMQLYRQHGRRYKALRQYQQLRDALRRALDAEPAPHSQRLYAEILSGATVPDPSVGDQQQGTPPADRHSANHDQVVPSLPAPLSRFIGRTRELDEGRRLLSATQLLTLTGGGGVGKTRLALQLAAELTGVTTERTWVVDLAGLVDSGSVLTAVSEVVGARDAPDRPLTDVLADAIHDGSRSLLMLDNCEHLLAACGRLVQVLLARCPELRVLATSREPLHVEGETVWRVPSLDTPDPERLPPIEQLPRFDAIRLFLDRAASSRPGFSLTPSNAVEVVAVCHRLDGLPLAIELAAAWVNVLSVRQIAERLDAAIDLLGSESRTGPPRHRSMRAALDWSYDLLSEQDRIVFRRLSVFAGGWTLEAAEAVCAGGGIERRQILHRLARLIERSLVLADERGTEMRYRLLEPVRQYAAARREAAGEADLTLRGHRDTFLALAEAAEPELLGAGQAEWLERLATEHDNLRAAVRWSLDVGEAEAAIRFGAALWRFWWVRGLLTEGRAWLSEALARPGEVAATWRANALNGAGNLAWSQGDHVAARRLLSESLRLKRIVGDPVAVARSLTNLGTVEYVQGDLERAAALYEESLEFLQASSGEGHAVANALNNLAVVRRDRGEYTLAQGLFEQALQLRRDLGDLDGESKVLANLGILASIVGQTEQARMMYLACLAVARPVGRQESIAFCLEGLAWVAAADGHVSGAVRLLAAAERLRETMGWPRFTADRVRYEQMLGEFRSRLPAAEFDAAWAAGHGQPAEDSIQAAIALTSTPVGTPVEARPRALTPREREVARLVVEGMTNRQIAEQLVTSTRTVDTHVGRILHKLGLSSRSELDHHLEGR